MHLFIEYHLHDEYALRDHEHEEFALKDHLHPFREHSHPISQVDNL